MTDLHDISLEQFLAWAKTKPSEKPSLIWDNQNCPLAQYAKEKFNFAVPYAGGISIRDYGNFDSIADLTDFNFFDFEEAMNYGQVVKKLQQRQKFNHEQNKKESLIDA